MYGAEAAGLGVDTEHHAATLTKGRPGVLHGSLMDVLQDAHGQILEAFSISAGLDYPGIGPEHSHYHDIKRATYVPVTDEEALEGFQLLSRVEGIIPALESSHALSLIHILNDLEAFYVLGSAVGPHPYPTIVHEFQKVISEESRRQILEKEGRLPDYVIACVGGGSNAIGAFSQYVADEEVKLVGVEAAGHGLDTDMHAATMTKGSVCLLYTSRCV